MEVPLWKILLLKSHVTLEGQDRLTGIRVGRTMLVVIWRTEEEAWQWRGDFLLCARGRLGVIIVFFEKPREVGVLGQEYLSPEQFQGGGHNWRATESRLV